MNKSIEYIKSRIKDGATGETFPLIGWDSSEILNPLVLLKKFFKAVPNEVGEIISVIGERTYRVSYDPNTDFDYFTSKQATHDGTLIFSIAAIRNVLAKVLAGCTYCRDKAPKNYADFSIPAETSIVMGDVILLTERGMHKINGHEMMSEKQTVVIPIKWSAELHSKK